MGMFGRAVYLKLVKFLLFTLFYLGLVYFYLHLAKLTEEEGEVKINKVEKVLEAVQSEKKGDLNTSDFAVDEEAIRDEFKGVEGTIYAFNKLADPFDDMSNEDMKEDVQESGKEDKILDNKNEEWVEGKMVTSFHYFLEQFHQMYHTLIRTCLKFVIFQSY